MHVIVNVSVWEGCWFRHADVVCSCPVCIPCKLLSCVLNDLQFVNAGQGCHRRLYG